MAAEIRHCGDLTTEHIEEALVSRRATAKLLRQLGAVARPNDGAPKILVFLAELAKRGCSWIEGRLCVDVEGVDGKTHVLVTEELGGVRELLAPRLIVDAPFAEFEKSIKGSANELLPLELDAAKTKARRWALVDRSARPTRSLPPFELAEDCLRRTRPPAARKSARPAAIAPPAAPVPVLAPPPAPVVEPKRARPPARRASVPDDGFPILEIPRAPKVLDFGDFTAREAKPSPAPAVPRPKKPSRLPPRGAK